MLYVPTMMYFITWMQLTYFARFAIAFVCHCDVFLPMRRRRERKFFMRGLRLRLVKVMLPP